MMNFGSDGIEEYDELVATLDKCEYRSKPKKYELDMKNRTSHNKSAENGLVKRSTDPIDSPSIDPRTVNGIRRSQRVRERAAGASSSAPIAEVQPILRDLVSATDGAEWLIKSSNEGARISEVGTTEGAPTDVPAGSGKRTPLLIDDSPALCATDSGMYARSRLRLVDCVGSEYDKVTIDLMASLDLKLELGNLIIR
uniref:Integrase core domain containing protein n=1 Tax=Solanum tuberosum TaxID=4113 RepID=M1DMI9_SOLTU